MNEIAKNKYSGQALAIAMLILVISSLIGLAMYSRTTKDKSLTLEERASAEALEVSDILLNNVTGFTVEEIIAALNEHHYTEPGEVFDEDEGVVLIENNDKNEISNLFTALGLMEIGDISTLIDPLCPVGITPNEYQLTFRKTPPDIGYELRPGHVWSFPTRHVTILAENAGSCALKLTFSSIGDPYAGFALTRWFCEYDEITDLPTSCPGYDEYDYNMMEKHRFVDETGVWYEGFKDDDNWTDFNTSGGSIEINLKPSPTNDVPTEIRIKALGRLGSPGIKIYYELDGQACPEGINMYQLRASANCSEVYRGKEIIIPQRGHNVLFDYVYFSGM